MTIAPGNCGLRMIARHALLATGGLLLAATAATAQDRVPDFSYSRPVGPRQPMPPMPEQPPVPPKIQMGVFRPFNAIDQFILARIKEVGLKPAPECDDWTFARRACLDLVGVVPPVPDLELYFSWDEKERRKKWADYLLELEQYADHWAIFWGDLLRERGRVRGAPLNTLREFLHDRLKRNRPFDEWVGELIAAEGRVEDNPATAFIIQDRADADTLTVSTAQAFLGLQIQCAQCHDHPFDWWTQKDYEGMAAFWRGTRTRRYANMPENPNRPLFEVLTRPRRPAGIFLTGTTSAKGRDRAALADLITRPGNPYFARNVVNRLWTKLMGAGLINPPDGLGPLNPPSHPELLDWLAMEFIDSGHDLKHVLRLIVLSRTYQQASREKLPTIRRRDRIIAAKTEDAERIPPSYFDHMPLRRMTAEQLKDSILMATGRYDTQRGPFAPSVRTVYPPPPRSFLAIFGVTDRQTVLPRPNTGSIQQTLTLLNDDFVNNAIRLHPSHPLRELRQRNFSLSQLIDAAFVSYLTRMPNNYERRWAADHVGNGSRNAYWEDLQWALINTREFQFIR